MTKSSKSKMWAGMIALAVLSLVVLSLLLFPGKGAASASGIQTYGVDEYLELMEKEQISTLFENIDGENNTAYVLHHSAEGDLDWGTLNTYAVYIPNAGGVSASGLVTAGPVFGRHLRLTLAAKEQAGNAVFCFSFYSDKEMAFRVYMDGNGMDMKITDVDFHPIPSVEQ